MRFTLSYHSECRDKEDHYDFFLEDKESLVTFSLKEPLSNAKICLKINDHRKIYLDFEGKISDAKGNIKIVEKGEFKYLEKLPDRVSFEILGKYKSYIVIQKQSDNIWLIEKT